MASTGAPVCSDSKDEVIKQPTPNNLLGIPVATDLPTAIAAVNAMRAVLQNITGRTGGFPPKPFTPQYNGFTSKKTTSRWSEVSGDRVKKVVKVYNPNDKTQFIEVEQINGVTMQDQVTGDKWTWKR